MIKITDNVELTGATGGYKAKEDKWVVRKSKEGTNNDITSELTSKNSQTSYNLKNQTTRSNLNISSNSISLSESPRIMETLACEPAFPPVSISIGIYAVSTTKADRASSNPVMMAPVNVALIIKNKSQGILLL